jgi:hypothetical protein
MRHRSEWFLSDPTGLVTVKCRPSSMLLPATSGTTSGLSSIMANPGPPSLPLSRPPPLPTSHPPTIASRSAVHGERAGQPTSSMGRLSPNVCDIKSPMMMMIGPLPNSSTGQEQQQQQQQQEQQQSVRLRRKLSDKDKERRLVRRSSSKRKDKENGGDSSSPASTSSSGLERPPESSTEIEATTTSRGNLKRAGSAEVTASNNNHTILCRTGSQDTPHVEAKEEAGGCGLTRSLPRI